MEKEISNLSFVLTKGLSRKTKHRLLRKYTTEEIIAWDLLEYQKALTEKEWVHFLKYNSIYNIEEIKSEREKMDKKGVRLILFSDSEYPKELRNCPDPPLALFAIGKPLFPKRRIAVIGARNSTPYGREMASWFSNELAKAGAVIVSGLAEGADASGHNGALRAGGDTIGVLGCGTDVVYPRENFILYEKIKEQGTLISEYPMGTKPEKYHFPERNRIISGISDGVLIVEARKRSGSLITADCALEQGRDVFVIPGRIGDVSSEGCNWLIREGARLVTEPDQILEELYEIRRSELEVFHKKDYLLDNKEKILYDCLGLEPKSMEDIIKETSLPMSEIISIAFRLELRGIIKQVDRGYYMISLQTE